MSALPKPSSRGNSLISKKIPKNKPRSSRLSKKILSVEIEKTVPEGVVSLLLTSSTQTIFNLRVDEDVTATNYMKKIKKEDLVKDIFNRAAVSDFKPFKDLINNYPEDEILICYDHNFQYGNNFYMATTLEAANMLQASEKPMSEESSEEVPLVYIPPVSKRWLSYGSEKEIEEETVQNRSKPITILISGSNKILTSKSEFRDREVDGAKDGLINIKPFKCDDFVVKIPLYDKGTHTVEKQEDCSTQVEWKYPLNQITQYEPRELDDQDKEQTQTRDEYTQAVFWKEKLISVSLQQNELFDIFDDEWCSLGDVNKAFDNKLDIHLREYQSFSDLKYTNAQIVSCIRWHPLYSGVIAVSLIHGKTYEFRINNEQNQLIEKSLILFWCFSDPINPQLILEAPDDVTVFDFNPSNPHYVAAGCLNGTIVLWDITEFAHVLQPQATIQKPVDVLPGYENEPSCATLCCDTFSSTAIGASHTCAVTDLIWIPSHFEISKNGEPMENSANFSCQLLSCALDCTLFLFDIRNYRLHQWEREKGDSSSPNNTFDYLNLTWKPLVKITTYHREKSKFYYPMKFSIHECTNPENSRKQQNCPMTVHECSQKLLTADKTILNSITTMFYVGTDDGDLVYLNWMPEKDFENGKFETPKPEFAVQEHYGHVTALIRSPFLRDLILCVGGWNFSLWKENFHLGPLIKSKRFSRRLTSADWSPSRPSVFYIGRDDGSIDIWDLLDRTHKPTASQSISLSPITSINITIINKKQHLMAVGDEQATLHIIKIPTGLCVPHLNELSQFKNHIDREIKRRIFVKRRHDIREDEKQREHAEHKKQAGMAPLVVLSKEEIEVRMKQEYNKFLDTEREVLFTLGIIQE